MADKHPPNSGALLLRMKQAPLSDSAAAALQSQPADAAASPVRRGRIRETFHRYERHLSALAMVGGFAFDNYFFRRIDIPATQLLFAAYIFAAAVAIALLHAQESRAQPDAPRPRWWIVFPMVTQFAFGSLWSGFLIFYARSAVLAASWPFLLMLGAVFLGNEVLRRYHSRLLFSTMLLFFALFSYTIFIVPIYLRAIGTIPFLISGAIAVGLFVVFLRLLAALGRDRFRETEWKMAGGALAVFLSINFFYFTNILPPLPLALSDAGVYHAIHREGAVYQAAAEQQDWKTRFGWPAQIHAAPGDRLYAFSAVFAPIKLATRITHRWQHYDMAKKRWLTRSVYSFGIVGGRDGGYRGYSAKSKVEAGDWRVDIETDDKRMVGRLAFTVTPVAASVVTIPKTLR